MFREISYFYFSRPKNYNMRLIKTVLFIFCFSTLSAQQSPLDSMLQKDRELTGKARVDNLINISRQLFINGDTLSRQYSRKAIEISRELTFDEGIGKAALFLALTYDPDETDSAVKYYRLSSGLLSGMNHSWASYGYANAAQLFRNMGWYPESLEYYVKALEIYQRNQDTNEIAKVTSSIGFLYDRMGNHREAIQWQRDALKIIKGRNDKAREGLIYGRIGISFDEMGMYDSAHFYNNIAVQIFDEIDDQYYKAQWFSNIGNTFIKQGEFSRAEAYLQQAMLNAETDVDRIVILNNLGKVFIETERYTRAKRSLEEAMKIAGRLEQNEFLLETYYRLHEYFEKKGDYKEALDYFEKYNALKDSILDVKKAEQIARMKVRFETDQKEKQLLLEKAEKEELAKEKALAEIALFNRNKWIIGISSTGAIAILLLFVLVQRNKRKAQAEKDAAIIREKEASLDAVITAQEEERKRIAKDLHDGIVQQVAGIILAWNKIFADGKKANEEEKKLIESLEESRKDLREISHRMMPKALREFGVKEAMEDLLENSLGISEIQYEFDCLGLDKRLDEKLELSLFRIAQESINNILKHSKATEVNVQLYKKGNEVILMIEDNGVGLPENLEKKGLGLRNIESRTEALNGIVNFENGPEGGLITMVRIPAG